MEDVLDVYHRPYDPDSPQVCIDETSKQLVLHARTPLAAKSGRLRREDDEYKRCGTANVFLCVEPLTGRTVIEATERRTAIDFARFVRDLCDGPYRKAKKLVVVMDNLNVHSAASLYQAFEPAEARRLAEKLEIHYTPKHGSWLNMAEIELSVLGRQCLDQRIGSMAELRTLTAAWLRGRKCVPIDWRFTTKDARVKLRRLYPVVLDERHASATRSPEQGATRR
jgi:hypothetical protein